MILNLLKNIAPQIQNTKYKMEYTGILSSKNYIDFQVLDSSGEALATFYGGVAAGKAFPGDTVCWNPEKQTCKLIQRRKQYPLVGILELASKTTYGMTSRGVPMYLFTPFLKEYPFMVVGCSHKDKGIHQLAVVEFDSWDTTSLPRANLRQLLGPCGNLVAEQNALLLTFNPFKLRKQFEMPSVKEDWCAREKCPSLTFNIDPAGCQDIDDVLSIQRTNTHDEIWITIADVAEIIPPDSELDRFAALQGATAYQDGGAVQPMLPFAYSEGSCSLLPGQLRPGISLVLTYEKGRYEKPMTVTWKLTCVQNKRQYDYDSFLSDAKADGIDVLFLSDVASGLLGRRTMDTHEWIEAFMLCYNLEAARVLRQAKRGVLRKHGAPDLEKLKRYECLGGAEMAVLAQQAATYCPAVANLPFHYGLSAQVYCHASSPIRRYADLLNQRIIKDVLLGTNTSVESDIVWLNKRQRDLKRFERDVFFLSQLRIAEKATLKGIVVEIKIKEGQVPLKKVVVWIPAWKRTIKIPCSMDTVVAESFQVRVSYFANPATRSWKDRIVFRLEM